MILCCLCSLSSQASKETTARELLRDANDGAAVAGALETMLADVGNDIEIFNAVFPPDVDLAKIGAAVYWDSVISACKALYRPSLDMLDADNTVFDVYFRLQRLQDAYEEHVGKLDDDTVRDIGSMFGLRVKGAPCVCTCVCECV